MTRRARLEKRHGLLRLIVRSWREWVDDVRAGAAKWEVRWQQSGQHGQEHRLARRLHIGTDLWLHPSSVTMRRLLEYMRLVRAPYIHMRRRESAQWQALDTARRAALAATAPATPAPVEADETDDVTNGTCAGEYGRALMT